MRRRQVLFAFGAAAAASTIGAALRAGVVDGVPKATGLISGHLPRPATAGLRVFTEEQARIIGNRGGMRRLPR